MWKLFGWLYFIDGQIAHAAIKQVHCIKTFFIMGMLKSNIDVKVLIALLLVNYKG